MTGDECSCGGRFETWAYHSPARCLREAPAGHEDDPDDEDDNEGGILSRLLS